MFDAALVAPEVRAAEVAERQPDAGMHGVVVRGIRAGDRRMIAGGFHTAGGMNICEVRPQDLLIAKDELGHRLAGVPDDEPVRAGQTGSRPPPVRSRECRHRPFGPFVKAAMR